MKELYILVPDAKKVDNKSTVEICVYIRTSEDNISKKFLPINQLQSLANHFTVLILPIDSISWHYISLPLGIKINKDKRLIPALQGLLEDEILGDASNVHVALQPAAKTGSEVLVGVCNKQWLAEWRSYLEKYGITVNSIKPQITPDMAKRKIIINKNSDRLWACWFDRNMWIVPLKKEVISFLPNEPIWVTTDSNITANEILNEKKLRILSEDRYINSLRKSKWDLAQNEYSSDQITVLRRKIIDYRYSLLNSVDWKSSRIALTSIFLIAGIGMNSKMMLHKYHLAEKKVMIVNAVQETFPNLKVIVDPVLQMEREVEALRKRSGLLSSSDYLPMLTVIGESFKTLNIQPQIIDYKDNEMTIRGINVEKIDQLIRNLENLGYKATKNNSDVKLKAELE